VDRSSPNFFRPTWKGLWLIKFFSDVRYVDPFRRYLRSKSKVVKNRAKIWTFFWPSQILGGWPSKSCTRVITPALRHVVWISFVKILPPAPKLLSRGRGVGICSTPKKNQEKYFSGKNNVKIGNFFNFSDKNHIGLKFGHFINFSCTYFRAKCLAP